MSKFFKKIMCALALVPCFTMFAACDKTPADETPAVETPAETPADTTPSATLTEDQMYAKVNDSASDIVNKETKVLALNTTSQEVGTLGTLQKVPATGALGSGTTNSGLNEYEEAMVMSSFADMLNEMLGVSKASYNYGYNLNDGTGYAKRYYKAVSAIKGDGSLKTSDEMLQEVGTTLTEDDFTDIKAYVKVADKVAQYTKSVDEGGEELTSGAYVGTDHVDVDITSYILENISVLNTLSENTTFTSFKTNILSLTDAASMLEGLTLEDVNVTASVVKDGDNYVLTATMSSKEPISITMMGMNYEMSLTGTSVITFNDNGLVSSSNDADITMAVLVPNMPEMDSVTGQMTGNTYTLKMPVVMDMSEAVQFGSTLDTALLNAENYADYIQTELENAQITIRYNIDGEFYTAREGAFDDVATFLNLADMEDLHATFSGWYVDEACTIPVELEKLPSYTIDLYAKTLEITEGYAKITLQVKVGANDEYPYVCRNIYASVTDGFDYTTHIDSLSYSVVSVTVNGEDYGTANSIVSVTSQSEVNVVVVVQSIQAE